MLGVAADWLRRRRTWVIGWVGGWLALAVWIAPQTVWASEAGSRYAAPWWVWAASVGAALAVAVAGIAIGAWFHRKRRRLGMDDG